MLSALRRVVRRMNIVIVSIALAALYISLFGIAKCLSLLSRRKHDGWIAPQGGIDTGSAY